MEFKNLSDIQKLHGSNESDTLEFKREFIDKNKLLKHILGFINGHKKSGNIIIGVPEDDQGRADCTNIIPIIFPITIADNTRLEKFDNLKLWLTQSLKSYLPKYTEGLFNIQYVENTIIVITIYQSTNRPLYNKDSKAYIRRANSTDEMTPQEIEELITEKISRKDVALPTNQHNKLELLLKKLESEAVLNYNNIDYKFQSGAYLYVDTKPENGKQFSNNFLKNIQTYNILLLGRPKGCSRKLDGDGDGNGIVIFDPNQITKTNAVNYFAKISAKDGSISSFLSLENHQNTKGIPPNDIKTILSNFMENIISFYIKELQIDPYMQVSIGLKNIKGYKLALTPRYYEDSGEIESEKVEHSDYLNSQEQVNHIVHSFCKKMWDAAGEKMPE